MANPKWRNIQKTQWIDRKRPFGFKRADENLISDRSPTKFDQKTAKSTDPYTGISELPQSKKLEDRLVIKKK